MKFDKQKLYICRFIFQNKKGGLGGPQGQILEKES